MRGSAEGTSASVAGASCAAVVVAAAASAFAAAVASSCFLLPGHFLPSGRLPRQSVSCHVLQLPLVPCLALVATAAAWTPWTSCSSWALNWPLPLDPPPSTREKLEDQSSCPLRPLSLPLITSTADSAPDCGFSPSDDTPSVPSS